jgi:aminoglycoside 6'-N-acetyltransferase I
MNTQTAYKEILDLKPEDLTRQEQAGKLLVIGFVEHWPRAWPDLQSAMEEVRDSLAEDRISRIAINEGGEVVGWIGGVQEYYGQAWELHPLVVHPDYQGKGIGKSLVSDFEEQVKERGGIMIFLGTDDEDEMTSLGSVDLYPDVLEHLSNLKNVKRHPFEFYQALGFTVVGAIPDANGPGKPDILMAKRVGIVK